MERKVQEHKQELERLRQATKLDKGRLTHEAKLKNEAAGVSGVRSYNYSMICKMLCGTVRLLYGFPKFTKCCIL